MIMRRRRLQGGRGRRRDCRPELRRPPDEPRLSGRGLRQGPRPRWPRLAPTRRRLALPARRPGRLRAWCAGWPPASPSTAANMSSASTRGATAAGASSANGRRRRTTSTSWCWRLPPEQAVELLTPAPGLARVVSTVRMDPCLVAMVGFASPVEDRRTSRSNHGHAVRSSAPCASRTSSRTRTTRPGSSTARRSSRATTSTATSIWWRTIWWSEFAHAVGDRLPPVLHLRGHRWRYAQARRPLGMDCLFDPLLGLGVCGDWCRGITRGRRAGQRPRRSPRASQRPRRSSSPRCGGLPAMSLSELIDPAWVRFPGDVDRVTRGICQTPGHPEYRRRRGAVSRPRRDLLPLAAILALAAALRLWRLGQGLPDFVEEAHPPAPRPRDGRLAGDRRT